MIHPASEIKRVNDGIGCGVFATAPIPRGSAVYVQDELELIFEHDDPRLRNGHMRQHILKYSFTGPKGERVLSWDHAKYVNHCCEPNCLSTGYGFEIAVRDIQEGEEITDDYGLFMFSKDEELRCLCGAENCRGRLRHDDIDRIASACDGSIMAALQEFTKVDQPLVPIFPVSVRRRLMTFLNTGKSYRSVQNLKPRRTRASARTVSA